MQLYERIRLLLQEKGVSQSKLSELLGVYPQKFSQWLNEKSQKNLWEHLPKILEIFPDVRPEWLYYDGGPMLAADAEPAGPRPERSLEQELEEDFTGIVDVSVMPKVSKTYTREEPVEEFMDSFYLENYYKY